MDIENIWPMKTSITSLPRGGARDQLFARTAAARRQLGDPHAGRAWINGREVGGANGRYAHLAVTHD